MDISDVALYDGTKETDYKIVLRVNELAKKYNATMTQVALAWHFSKGTVPIIGVTKIKYLDDAVGAFNTKLTEDDIKYLEEPYVPHKIVGAI